MTRDGKVAVEGGPRRLNSALSLASAENAGASAIVYTDVARDGMLQGLNLDATIAPAAFPSGNRVGDWHRLKTYAPPCSARAQTRRAIAGAPFDRKLDPTQALRLIRSGRALKYMVEGR